MVQAGTLVALYLLRPILREDRLWLLLLVLAVVANLALPELTHHWPRVDGLYSIWLRNAVKYAPFFLFGVIFSRAIRSMTLPAAWLPAVLAVFAGLGVLAATVRLDAVPRLGVAAVMSFCVLALSQILCRGRRAESRGVGVLVALGQATLAIFVAHTIFSAAFRVALLKAGVTFVPVYVVGVTLVGLFGPLALLHLADRCNLSAVAGLRSLRQIGRRQPEPGRG